VLPGSDRENDGGPVAGSDERVLGAGRAVHEVELPQSPRFALDDEQSKRSTEPSE
jgi:hypothetical protein